MEEATKTIFRSQKTYGQVATDVTDSRKQIPKTAVSERKGNLSHLMVRSLFSGEGVTSLEEHQTQLNVGKPNKMANQVKNFTQNAEIPTFLLDSVPKMQAVNVHPPGRRSGGPSLGNPGSSRGRIWTYETGIYPTKWSSLQ